MVKSNTKSTKRRSRGNLSPDPGSEATTRLVNSANSAMSPPVNIYGSTAGKRFKTTIRKLNYTADRTITKPLRRSGESAKSAKLKKCIYINIKTIEFTGELQKVTSENSSFRGGLLSTYPIISANRPDLVEFRSNLLIHLGLVGCSKFLNKENPEMCEKIEENNHYRNREISALVQGINIQKELLFNKKQKHVFAVLTHPVH